MGCRGAEVSLLALPEGNIYIIVQNTSNHVFLAQDGGDHERSVPPPALRHRQAVHVWVGISTEYLSESCIQLSIMLLLFLASMQPALSVMLGMLRKKYERLED